MKHRVYLVCVATRSSLYSNKRIAIRAAKALAADPGLSSDAAIYAMDARYFREVGSWDVPTFRVLADHMLTFPAASHGRGGLRQ